MGHYNSFIVRFWSDRLKGKARGHIQHVRTREDAYFMDHGKMNEFIQNHLEPPLDTQKQAEDPDLTEAQCD